MVRTCNAFLYSTAFFVMFGNALATVHTKWTADTYPNPYLQPQNCSRMTQSYVCDPDEILKEGQADQLDNIILRIRNETACLCKECPTPHGMAIAVALMESLSNSSLGSSIVDGGEMFASVLRERWHFGQCDDDVLLFVSSVDQEFHASMGSTVAAALDKNIAIRIFQANRYHFITGYYYQGLESIMESYYDVLRRQRNNPYNDQQTKPSFSHNKDIIVALVVSVTTLIALLVFVTIIICRLRKAREKTEEAAVGGDSLTRWHASKNKKSPNADYERCSMDDHGEDDNSSEGSSVLSETDSEILSEMFQINRMYNIAKRQLSAVPEESEEEDDEEKAENSKRRTSSIQRKASVNGMPKTPQSQENEED